MWVNRMKKIKFKSNNGVTTMDIAIAITILSLFVGVIGNFYYQIVKNNNMIRFNTMAVYYAIKIAEDIDKVAYEDVNDDFKENLNVKYGLPENFNATLDIENYNESDSSKQDIIKKVNITIKYTFLKEERSYKIEKLKIKEL